MYSKEEGEGGGDCQDLMDQLVPGQLESSSLSDLIDKPARTDQ
jgi:hypothetical protein